MVAAVAEPEVYTGRVPSTYADRMRERRRLDAVASDLIASSRRVEVPDGVFTVVNAKFLGELLDVCHATGERLFVVVDEFHLARVAQVAERRVRIAELIAEMKAAQAAEGAA